MPAEWEPHVACYMEWPTLTRKELWADRFDEAKRDYAAVANAIAAFEPVVMVCDPDQETEVRRSCAETVEILPLATSTVGRPMFRTMSRPPGSGSTRRRWRRRAPCTISEPSRS